MTLQIVRDWVVRFNAQGPDGLIDRKAPGQPSRLNDSHRAALGGDRSRAARSRRSTASCAGGLSICASGCGRSSGSGIARQTLSRELRALGYRKLSARPRHHAQAEGAIEHFKKASPPCWTRSRARRASSPAAIEVWFADEARVGQKNKITRRWARRGTRPAAPQDQRTASTYIFGAICPRHGKGAALVLPRCNTAGDEPAPGRNRRARWRPGAHAVLLLDQAGWHLSDRLVVPPNITLMPLPPKCPELNPVENVWQFMRDNWLSNRVFRSYDDIVDHCCDAWNKLVDQPWRIMSIGLRDWAHGF